MADQSQLDSLLRSLDRASYRDYRGIKGVYDFAEFTLTIDHVQADPFASLTKVWVRVPQAIAQFPPELYQTPGRRIALEDFITRRFNQAARELSDFRGTGKSGMFAIPNPGQEILDRSTVQINDDYVEVRFGVGLPAQGRSIMGFQAVGMLCEDIPEMVASTLKYHRLNQTEIQHHVALMEDADHLRAQLPSLGLVAFIPNGAVLPRRSGADNKPLQTDSVVFQSPPSLEIELICPNQGRVKGMGIPTGITLIVGGGYHGKSTLLRAIELGIYNHIPGDGRELVVTHSHTVKIRAEDGRSIAGVNISAMIKNLPQGKSTAKFSSSNASGSTSQVANMMEALEMGAKVLLIDEDTAATNLMIRDRRMQELIAPDKEPITPFIDKIDQLYEELGVSVVLVMGGSGDYFTVADQVIAMDNFQAVDVTEQAHAIADKYDQEDPMAQGSTFGELSHRIPDPRSIDPSKGRKAVKTQVKDLHDLAFGSEAIDLRGVEQLVDKAQVRAIAAALVYGRERYMDQSTPCMS